MLGSDIHRKTDLPPWFSSGSGRTGRLCRTHFFFFVSYKYVLTKYIIQNEGDKKK